MPNKQNNRVERTSDAVAYARVSTKDQEREGFSIPAQLRLINEYAAGNGLRIIETYTEAESAGHTGREAFGRMMSALKSPGSCRTILVEKTDRLYRNARDMVDLNDLKVEIHFIKEGRVVSEDSKPGDKLVNTILTATAQHFLDNLREETRKGMLEKARSGLWPSCAPLGYLNTPGPDGKKIIVPDPEAAPHVRRLFERYATGTRTLRVSSAVQLSPVVAIEFSPPRRGKGWRQRLTQRLPGARLLLRPAHLRSSRWLGERAGTRSVG